MLSRCCAAALVLLAVQAALSQADVHAARRYAALINEQGLKADLTVLASDGYLGRETGKEGQRLAAAYLRKRFSGLGIRPLGDSLPGLVDGYYQRFDLVEEQGGTLRLRCGRRQLASGKGLAFGSQSASGTSHFRSLRPWDAAPGPPSAVRNGEAVLIRLPQLGSASTQLARVRPELERLRMLGAKLVLVQVPDSVFELVQASMQARSGRMSLVDGEATGAAPASGIQALFVTMESVKRLLGAARAQRLEAGAAIPCRLKLESDRNRRPLSSDNVLAFIPGSDLADEVVLITAHYDHLGVHDGVVHNGADDDGSGTVALLALAEVFMAARNDGTGPRRSILIMPVSGEEKGLLGSRYYSDHPVIPLERTVADLNIDMIGRTDSAHQGSAPYVYVIGSDRLSSALHAANERANAEVGLELDYTFNAPDDPNRFYYRSDHYNFARKGVPSIFYFSGVHEDYHGPGDDTEKIRFDLLLKRTQLVFHTAWILANAPERPAVDKP
jgi:hypothetical protein